MSDFGQLLKRNRNYRYAWMGQIVSEVGDHFNNVAVLSLAVEETHNGAVVAGLTELRHGLAGLRDFSILVNGKWLCLQGRMSEEAV